MARSYSSFHLTPDVHKVVQHAIGEVNNVAASPPQASDPPRKKRKRKENDTPETTELAFPVNEERTGADEGKRRKRKRKTDGQSSTTEVGSTPQVAVPFSEAHPPTANNRTAIQGKKKRKKKDTKGKQRADHPLPDVPIDPTLIAQSSGGANAFLSAVMTAAAAAASSSTPSAAAVSAAQQVISAQATSQDHAHQVGYPDYTVPHGMPGYTSMPPAHASAHVVGYPPPFPPGALPPDLEGIDMSLTGEEIARVLQDLDFPKIANALRVLGDTSASKAFPLPGQAGPGQSGTGPTSQHVLPDHTHAHAFVRGQDNHSLPTPIPINAGLEKGQGSQVPAPSALILGQPLRNSVKSMLSKKAGTATLSDLSEQDLDHAHLLANKWLSATKLNELAKFKGLVYKKGKFSATEEALIKDAIESYRDKNSLNHEQLNELIFAKGAKGKDSAFWFEITSQVPQRPVVAVYHYVRRRYHPLKQQGRWMPAEDDVLRQAVAEYGQAWEKVSMRVGRMAGDCRDRWRNHINNREGRIMGQWSKEEEERLTQIVTEMTTARGKNPDTDIFWTIVATRMGNTRGRHQCRIKWTDALNKTVKNEGQKPRWSQQDAYILVHKIASLNVRDDSEIDWKLLIDEDWNLWSAHSLQRRWLTLKRSIRGHDEMTHQEIMDILRVKKAHAPPTPAPVKVRVTSAPVVPADAQAADVDIGDVGGPIAGPSGFLHSVNLAEPTQQHFASMVAPADTQGDFSGMGLATIAEAHDVQVPSDDSSSSSSSSSPSSDGDSDSSDSD